MPVPDLIPAWLANYRRSQFPSDLIAGLVVAVYAAWVLHDMPDASELADYRPATATRVFAGDGTLIGEFSDERRIYVTYDQVPEQVIHAFLAAED